jgi:ribosomal protein S18 acetylase RimI-like enzyme
MPDDITIGRCEPARLERQRPVLLGVYEKAYADRLNEPFKAPSRYWERLRGHATRDGFTLLTATIGAVTVGYSFGYTLPAGGKWWHGLRKEAEGLDLAEDGHRTFLIAEIVIHPARQRRGYARRLHDRLLAQRSEQRAALLVRPDNRAAQAAYASWGWQKVGELHPIPASPAFDAMLKPLHPET